MRIFVLALALIAATAGLSQTRSVVKPSSPTTKNSSTARSSDADLEKAIRGRLAASKISTNKFEVHVQGGVATLEGKTDIVQHKGTATRLARSAGAVKVVNKIEVSQAAKDKAASNLTSGRRRAQVKRSDVAGRK